MLHTKTSGSAGTSIQPSRLRTCRPPWCVLREDREQPVVGVLADAPRLGRRRLRRVVEDAEQHGRVGGEVSREPVAVEAEARGRCRARSAWPRRPPARSSASTVGPSSAGSAGNRFGPCSGVPAARAGRRGQLGAEVDALLAVGPARRELAADREPAPPGATAARPSRSAPSRVGEGEEVPATAARGRRAAPGRRRGRRREEAGVPAGGVDLSGDRRTSRPRARPRRGREQRPDVDHGEHPGVAAHVHDRRTRRRRPGRTAGTFRRGRGDLAPVPALDPTSLLPDHRRARRGRDRRAARLRRRRRVRAHRGVVRSRCPRATR